MDPVPGRLVPARVALGAQSPGGGRGETQEAAPPPPLNAPHCQAGAGRGSHLEKRLFFLPQLLTEQAGGACWTEGAWSSKRDGSQSCPRLPLASGPCPHPASSRGREGHPHVQDEAGLPHGFEGNPHKAAQHRPSRLGLHHWSRGWRGGGPATATAVPCSAVFPSGPDGPTRMHTPDPPAMGRCAPEPTPLCPFLNGSLTWTTVGGSAWTGSVPANEAVLRWAGKRENAPSKSGVGSADKGRLGSRCACGWVRGQQLLPARARRPPTPVGGARAREAPLWGKAAAEGVHCPPHSRPGLPWTLP